MLKPFYSKIVFVTSITVNVLSSTDGVFPFLPVI